MLEEGLRSPTFSPAEAAQGLLSFIRFELQDGGGANAEKRFITLFSLLCDRLFGPMSDDIKENFRHQTGGWLARQNRWDIPRRGAAAASSGSGSGIPTHTSHLHHAHNQTPTLDMDPVVQLLCGLESLKQKERLATFLEAISGTTEARRGVRVQYPFPALPKPTQDFLMTMVQSVCDGSIVDDSTRANAFRLFGGLLRVAPRDQTELRRLYASKTKKMDRTRPLTLSPRGMSSPFSTASKPTQGTKPNNTTSSNTPQIMLNMVEYFLFTFIRYPLASPAPTTPAPQGVSRHRISWREAYGETVYMHLFRCYLLHYLPLHVQGKNFIGFPTLSTENELFLRIIIELWLCNTMNIVPVQKVLESLLERRKKNGIQSATFGLDSAFDLVKVNYEPPVAQVRQCLKSLIVHTLKDPNVIPAIMDCNDIVNNKQYQTGTPLPWCLSPTMTILQPPMYNHVVVSFRHAPIHVTSSPFYAALDLWLLWLEPWNVEIRKKNASTDFTHPGRVLNSVTHRSSSTTNKPEIVHVLRTMKGTSPSKYTFKWEPYVAANLHLYTVPLALFLRRAKELDFSSLYFSRSFALLQRIFRIYSPELMATLNQLLQNGTEHRMTTLVKTHEKNLGAYSPSLVLETSMTSLQTDMHNLLEEIEMQYRKTVHDRGIIDRLEASIEGLFSYFGLAEASTGEERKIQQLVEKAKLVAGLPADYTIMPSDGGQMLRSSSGRLLDATVNVGGMLTESGKRQIMTGEITCRPTDILFARNNNNANGDGIYGSIKSHELSFLVPLTIQASEYFNSRFDVKYINLRFLADYRNVLFLVVSLWFWKRMLF